MVGRRISKVTLKRRNRKNSNLRHSGSSQLIQNVQKEGIKERKLSLKGA